MVTQLATDQSQHQGTLPRSDPWVNAGRFGRIVERIHQTTAKTRVKTLLYLKMSIKFSSTSYSL